MTKLYFIGGASGSGKTAIILELKKMLGDSIKIIDFDDIGVPDGADKKWRQESTEKWLSKLLSDAKDTCLLGQMVLGEILACPSAKQIKKVNFCLLDVADMDRIKRLTKNNTYGADQNMLNWSAWLRMHHQDPQWTQQVLKEDCWDRLDFSRWDQLDTWAKKANVNRLDTTNLSIPEVATQVANFVLKPQKINSVIFLNGPSSSGKTVLAQKLQDNLPIPHLHIGIDKIIEMMPEKLNDWKGNKVDQGFWWKLTQDTSKNKLAHIQFGPFARAMSSFLKKVVITALENGHSLIVDEVCVVDGSFDEWRKILSQYNVLYVGLKANINTLERREKERGNRMPGSARAQNAMVHNDKEYDIELDTGILDLDECVQEIKSHIENE